MHTMSMKAPAPEDLAVLRSELLMVNSLEHSGKDQTRLLELAKSVSIEDEKSVKDFIAAAQLTRALNSNSFTSDRGDYDLDLGATTSLSSIAEGDTCIFPGVDFKLSTERHVAKSPRRSSKSSPGMSLQLSSSRSLRKSRRRKGFDDDSTIASSSSSISNLSSLAAELVTTKVRVASAKIKEKAAVAETSLVSKVENLKALEDAAKERQMLEAARREALKEASKERKASEAAKRAALKAAVKEDLERQLQEAREERLRKQRAKELLRKQKEAEKASAKAAAARARELQKEAERVKVAAEMELEELSVKVEKARKEAASLDQSSTTGGSIRSKISKKSTMRSTATPISLSLTRTRSDMAESRDDDSGIIWPQTDARTKFK